ncbi:hypothetical protein K9U39_10985 [Rhodoblastus acidophilus]|uniref:HK97 gp10 family phage protein n=1 Tax=Candidatus Rhodoblastus alkanivorans TaxID=2954117 RepID=A0ABS9ZAQ7_9HYPH|nr:hypothetical protein [Candidatus Rhodoblastus alkanivorans]MCI4680179.1 hypothetical protein [Candidatus Rhodoblastus alkanivorans]MCI4684136.1 hypothetical protein [Candidatus Rhodoblastus alkanivorans]MDI4641456.1 hypothetical protein [Rhodoblastus acidophilus]
MFELSLKGASELRERFDELPDALRAALTDKVEVLARALYSEVVDVNLSGGVLNARSGALRDSIQMNVEPQDLRIDAEIFANGDVPYSGILEYGGKTSAHEILPDKAKALSFLMNGKQFFARRIQHPGSTFAARAYLGSALDEQGDDIVQGLQETVFAAAGKLKDSS